MGANLAYMVGYWNRKIYPDALPPEWERYVKIGRDRAGMEAYRIWASAADIKEDRVLSNLESALDMLHSNGCKALICLTNTGNHLALYHPSMNGFHKVNGELHYSFFSDPANYAPLIDYFEKVVSRFSDHPAVWSWQVGNEWKLLPQPEAATDENALNVLKFLQTASEAIWAADGGGKHPISLGLVDTAHIAAQHNQSGRGLAEWSRFVYESLPRIEIVSNHIYPISGNERWGDLWTYELERLAIDAKTAHDTGRAWIIDEAGAWQRPGELKAHHMVTQIFEMFQRLPNYAVPTWWGQWAFSPASSDPTNPDRGVADGKRGLYDYDSQEHVNAYNGVMDLYRDVNNGKWPNVI